MNVTLCSTNICSKMVVALLSNNYVVDIVDSVVDIVSKDEARKKGRRIE